MTLAANKRVIGLREMTGCHSLLVKERIPKKARNRKTRIGISNYKPQAGGIKFIDMVVSMKL
jgi:hypothetical protein